MPSISLFLILTFSLFVQIQAHATDLEVVASTPFYSKCQSEDQAVQIKLSRTSLNSEDQMSVDLRIMVKKGNGVQERTFPTQQRISDTRVVYTLLDSELELLIVDRTTSQGRVWKGLPGGQNPYVNVICQPSEYWTRALVVLAKPQIVARKGLSSKSRSQLHALESKPFLERYQTFRRGEALNLWIADALVIDIKTEALALLKNDPSVLSVSSARERVQLFDLPQEPQERVAFQKTPLVRQANLNFEANLEAIRLPQALKRFGQHLKARPVVGILDTGINPRHPDLLGKTILYKNFSPRAGEQPADTVGHGTHVAGIIAGGAKSGRQIGVAPQTQLVVARIFDQNLDSEMELILKALQWMADPTGDGSVRPQVVNASWGTTKKYRDLKAQTEPLCVAIRNLLDFQILTVAAAGNTGTRGPQSINIPGACPEALTVGAVNNSQQLLWFSSEGPAIWDDISTLKPEVTAPGYEIKSSVSDYLDYERQSGTSMAAPHVTGLVALISSLGKNLSTSNLRDLVMRSSLPLGKPTPNNLYGFGQINTEKALEMGNPL